MGSCITLYFTEMPVLQNFHAFPDSFCTVITTTTRPGFMPSATGSTSETTLVTSFDQHYPTLRAVV